MEAVKISRTVKSSLRVARESAGLTQEQAAKICGISVKRMERYEKNAGELTYDMAKKLIRLYGVPSFDSVHFGPEPELNSLTIQESVTYVSIDSEIDRLQKGIDNYVANEIYFAGTFRPVVKGMILKGFTGGILQLIPKIINSDPDLNEHERVTTIRKVVQELAELCKETVSHCSVSSNVSAGWFVDKEYYYIRFSCPVCSKVNQFYDKDPQENESGLTKVSNR